MVNHGGEMSSSQIYIGISILILILIAVLVSVVKRGHETKKLTPLTELAFGFVLAGLLFGGVRVLGYCLLGVGVALAVYDMARYRRTRN